MLNTQDIQADIAAREDDIRRHEAEIERQRQVIQASRVLLQALGNAGALGCHGVAGTVIAATPAPVSTPALAQPNDVDLLAVAEDVAPPPTATGTSSTAPATQAAPTAAIAWTRQDARLPVRPDSAEGTLLAWLRKQPAPMSSTAADLAREGSGASNALSSLYEKGAVERSASRVHRAYLYRAAGPGPELPLVAQGPAWKRATTSPRTGSMGALAGSLLELVKDICTREPWVTAAQIADTTTWAGQSPSATLADLWTAGHLERQGQSRGFRYRPVLTEKERGDV